MRPPPDVVGLGQESVWDYPRPAIAQRSARHIRIEHHALVLADTRAAVRTLETSHPPSYYLPPTDVLMTALRRSSRGSFCEWKGEASYYSLMVDGELNPEAVWYYADPKPEAQMVKDRVAFWKGVTVTQ